MLRAIVIILVALVALSAYFVSEAQAQKKTSKRIETPNERFERKGGRSKATETTLKQNGEVTAGIIAKVSTSHIFIEPDAAGKWQVVWRIARSHATPPNIVSDLPTIRRVEQKIINGKATSLIFKDSDGEEWQRL